MFYENERIVNKQLKFAKLRAYGIIQELEAKGLGDKEIIACIGLLLKDEVSEYQKDILEYALKTVNLRQEKSDAVQVIDNSYSWLDGRIQRKISPEPPAAAPKRKARTSNKN